MNYRAGFLGALLGQTITSIVNSQEDGVTLTFRSGAKVIFRACTRPHDTIVLLPMSDEEAKSSHNLREI